MLHGSLFAGLALIAAAVPVCAQHGHVSLDDECKGWEGMDPITGTGMGNILVNPSNFSQHEADINDIIDSAGTLEATEWWFFPNSVRRIHRQPLCGDNGENLDEQMQ